MWVCVCVSVCECWFVCVCGCVCCCSVYGHRFLKCRKTLFPFFFKDDLPQEFFNFHIITPKKYVGKLRFDPL
jgi:hypothetical protein